jgi:mediator of RNA polymerase II transcription subunit 16
MYSEKIKKAAFKPSLSSYGGKPLNGWIAVTATGLVSCKLLMGILFLMLMF